jgi:hypothetical protein
MTKQSTWKSFNGLGKPYRSRVLLVLTFLGYSLVQQANRHQGDICPADTVGTLCMAGGLLLAVPLPGSVM